MQSSIVMNGNKVTRLTVSSERITIKLSTIYTTSDIEFLESVAKSIQDDGNILVTMRGELTSNGVVMYSDSKSIKLEFDR